MYEEYCEEFEEELFSHSGFPITPAPTVGVVAWAHVTHSMAPAARYVGRSSRRRMHGTTSGQAPTLHNPYGLLQGQRTRTQAIQLYTHYIVRRLLHRNAIKVQRELLALAGTGLRFGVVYVVCHCAPLPCHGDVLRRLLRHYYRFGIFHPLERLPPRDALRRLDEEGPEAGWTCPDEELK